MSTYVAQLRAKIGHHLLLLPSVAAVIHDDSGRLLLQEKSSGEGWSLPAGAIEPGESPVQAIEREVLEETGLEVVTTDVLGVFGGRDFRYQYPNGDLVEYTVVLFRCVPTGDVREVGDTETRSLQYFARGDMPRLALPYPVDVLFGRKRESRTRARPRHSGAAQRIHIKSPRTHMTDTAIAITAAQASAYVRGRPDYPPALDEWLRRDLGLGAGKIAVDLGSGTGKFVPRLLAVGARVIAVEPSRAMRSELTALFPQVEAREGRAEAIPLADHSVDAVICAQCFHWFATDEALREIRRVLKPGGALGLVWNIRDATTPWVARLIEIMAPYDPGTPHYESQEWRAPFAASGFSALREHTFANPHVGPPETVIFDRVLSVGSIASLPPATRARVIAQVQAVIDDTPALAGEGQVAFPNVTYAYDCRVVD